MDDFFGHWIAGFIDGEGCFTIEERHSGPPYLYAHFALAVRADDGPVVREAQQATAIGKVFERAAYGKAKPQVVWKVLRLQECQALVELLNRFPLRSKKAADFTIWQEAVRIQTILSGAERFGAMLPLRQALITGRRWKEVV